MNDIQAILGSFAGVVPMGRWKSHNCPACIHNGQPRPDTRSRGGQMHGADGSFSFSCFNCGYKAHWKPGWKMHGKLLDLARWYGATDQQLMQMTLIADEIMNTGDYQVTPKESSYVRGHIIPKPMPETAKPFREWAALPVPPAKFIKVIERVYQRNPSILRAIDLWWCPDKEHQLEDRYLIPYYMNGDVVGYTGRITWRKANAKYFNQFPANMIYGFDKLNDKDRDFIFVTEGPIDAALIDGVAVNNWDIKEQQIEWLKKCGKEIIVVPDRDSDGQKMVEIAIQNNFSVALPAWETYEDEFGRKKLITDVELAVRKYGILYNMYLIKQAIYKNEMDIRVNAARWF